MTKIIWTNHLQDRIRQRGLNPRWVDTTIRFPDKILDSTTDNSSKHIKVINGYEIVAAVKRQGSDWIVTSAWWNQIHGRHATSKNSHFFLERWVDRLVRWFESIFTR